MDIETRLESFEKKTPSSQAPRQEKIRTGE
jgi:hypothetical protein